jgi:hypothetical protein
VSIAGLRIHPVFDREGDGRHEAEAGVGEEVRVKVKKRKKRREEGREGMDRERRRPGN